MRISVFAMTTKDSSKTKKATKATKAKVKRTKKEVSPETLWARPGTTFRPLSQEQTTNLLSEANLILAQYGDTKAWNVMSRASLEKVHAKGEKWKAWHEGKVEDFFGHKLAKTKHKTIGGIECALSLVRIAKNESLDIQDAVKKHLGIILKIMYWPAKGEYAEGSSTPTRTIGKISVARKEEAPKEETSTVTVEGLE